MKYYLKNLNDEKQVHQRFDSQQDLLSAHGEVHFQVVLWHCNTWNTDSVVQSNSLK